MISQMGDMNDDYYASGIQASVFSDAHPPDNSPLLWKSHTYTLMLNALSVSFIYCFFVLFFAIFFVGTVNCPFITG